MVIPFPPIYRPALSFYDSVSPDNEGSVLRPVNDFLAVSEETTKASDFPTDLA